ncbi:MAG: LysM peptidoglycan-binding domain-containing protein [Dehalococcoidia bacterium]
MQSARNLLARKFSRRAFVGGLAATAGASVVGLSLARAPRPGVLTSGLTLAQSTASVTAPVGCPHAGGPDLRHFAWVWQFSHDGDPFPVAARLAANGMAAAVKTHDGTDWMATYDQSESAIDGPAGVTRVSQYFESMGTPFHAWTVVNGLDPLREAVMGAEVLRSGARSLIIDLEHGDGFYYGDAQAALTYGAELRRLQPDAKIYLSIDPRPWRASMIPLAEFASFSDGIMPQVYWETFNSSGNISGYEAAGYPAATVGITPELVLDATADLLAPYGLPIMPTGQGDASSIEGWQRFTAHARSKDMNLVSTWRYGVTHPEVFPLLKATPPEHESYVLTDGESVSGLAERWAVSVDELVVANGVADPLQVQPGQAICRPV